MIKGVIFDADGPLYFRGPEVAKAKAELLAHYGIPAQLEQFEAAYDAEKFAAYTGSISPAQLFTRVFRHLDASLDEEIAGEFARDFDQIQDQVTARPDAAVTLQRLREVGLTTCVLTDSCYSSEVKWPWFERMGLAEHLNGLVSSHDTHLLKSDPAAFTPALKILGASHDEALFVGHQQYELDGAKAAHIRAVAVRPIAPSGVEADEIIERLPEVLDLIS